MTDDLRRDLRELPPPSLGVPGDLYERVMATARRRRRARWTGFSAVGLGVAGVLIAVGVSAAGNSGSARLVPITPPSEAPPATSSPTPTPTVTPTPTPTATAPAITQVVGGTPRFVPLSVSFVSPELGWAFGPDQAPNPPGPPPPGVLAVTHDGGQHWSTLPSPKLRYGGLASANSVLFVDANRGYLYGDGLFETRDGGLHWQRLAAPGPVTQLAVAGTHLYFMAYTCPALMDYCGLSDLYTGGLDGGDFVRANVAAATTIAQLSSWGSRVFVLWRPAGETTSEVAFNVSSSADGLNWSTFATPCIDIGADAAAVAPFGDSGLALMCGSSASAGIQGKTAYESEDFGAHWAMRGSLPEGGYVGPLGTASPSTWVVAEHRGTLLVTHDAGNTWQETTFRKPALGADSWAQVEFTDSQHAFAVPTDVYLNEILISTDSGNTWSAVTFTP